MADELTVGMICRFLKGNLTEIRFGGLSLKSTIAGSNMAGDTVTATNVDQILPKGDIGTIGFFYGHNLSESVYITAGADDTNQPIKIPPKQQIFTGFNGADCHVKTGGGSAQLQWKLLEA
jgi:hypothetical protein